ncbi:response regulator transcription factor [Ktedonosporobacter rubrisoli]|uniref:Response regulator transcription factor n=1 Tax=Ktedonosporobacter rubrisoli TaxID=2509675 RepID=A0A4P6JS47_KTERU|nr:response regulator transcription factor [Ktedonosporobacter rubrisoli]QBD77656.1 response regulator transcription factor [Ktedonosporobacter rubrisoli]
MPTVLLVEDTQKLAQVIIRELEAQNYHVLYAGDGLTALRLYEEEKPDIVILDWMLPGLDGLEVLRRIHQNAMTPVLMLTARSEEVDRVLSLEMGADDCLTKPFSMRELIARVHVLLRRVEKMQQIARADQIDSEQNVLHYGPLSLDPQAHMVILDGGEIELSPNEFETLHLLLRSPGRTFSRSYLQETIWKTAYHEGDRSVDNAMLRIRKKIGPLSAKIETVRSIGYRLRREGK